MNLRRKQIWLAFLGGVLLTISCGVVAGLLALYICRRSMFIIGLQWPVLLGVLAVILFITVSGISLLLIALYSGHSGDSNAS